MFENDYIIDKKIVSQVLKRYYKDNIQYMLYDPNIYKYVLIRWKQRDKKLQCSVFVYDKKIVVSGYKDEDKTKFNTTIVNEIKNIFKTHRSELELKCNVFVSDKIIQFVTSTTQCQNNDNQSKISMQNIVDNSHQQLQCKTLLTRYKFEDRFVIRSKYFLFVSKQGFEMNPRNYFYSRFTNV